MSQITVSEIIKELELTTNDDDIRQEVWVKILETGNSNAQAHLAKVIEDQKFNEDLQSRLKNIMVETQDADIVELIQHFSPNQQSIIILIILGYSLDFITRYKNMCNLRFTQTLKFISKHEVWGEYFEKEKTEQHIILWPDT